MSALDRIAKAITGRIRAYHSSPHDFDRFSDRFIGTGEGAQVYGRGHYFAENPAVSGQGGEYWRNFLDRFQYDDPVQWNAARMMKNHGFDRGAAINEFRDNIKFYENAKTNHPNAPWADQAVQDRAALKLLERGGPVGPRTYEVDINARPELFLNWDKGIAVQSPQVQDALRRVIPNVDDLPFNSGDMLYRHLADAVPGMPQWKEHASNTLRDAGIPGIRYLDAGSRGLPSNTGTSNYVVFDPGIVDIVKKYALPGVTTGGMGALAAQDQYGAQQ